MSRETEEFKHRTSIFEGAYRAWSYLGGLDPQVLKSKSVKDLDPIMFPVVNDSRSSHEKSKALPLREYPYEPLPRSGLGHPFVQAILATYLGSKADMDVVEMGLKTLRIWWHHRRKGENKTAIKKLVRVIVDKYTRHFFELAHCLVVSDNVQPPKTLLLQMKQSETERSGETADGEVLSASFARAIRENLVDPGLTPLEQKHAAQKLSFEGMFSTGMNFGPLISVKGKCIPGKIDLPGLVGAVNRYSSQLAHRGGSVSVSEYDASRDSCGESVYGDPKTTPVIFQTNSGDNLIVMEVDGITCAHCVKIVETVLKGCHGGKSPIPGLLNAAADRGLSCVVIQVDSASNAKRVAFESARNLSLVGYTAKPKDVSLSGESSGLKDRESLHKAVVDLANSHPFDFFDFTAPCSCPESGVFRDNCPRHSQMDERMYNAFADHERRLVEYVDSKSGASNTSILPQPIDQGIVSQSMNVQAAVRYKPLVVNQPTGLTAFDSIERASEVEPIQFQNLRQPRPMYDPAVGGISNDPRGSSFRARSFTSMSGISALASDWDETLMVERMLDDDEMDCPNQI